MKLLQNCHKCHIDVPTMACQPTNSEKRLTMTNLLADAKKLVRTVAKHTDATGLVHTLAKRAVLLLVLIVATKFGLLDPELFQSVFKTIVMA